MSTILTDLPNAVVPELLAIMPDLKSCEVFYGRFDFAEIKARSGKTPSVFVALIGCRQGKIYAGPSITMNVDLAAFVVCKDRLGVDREQAAGAISQTLAAYIPEKCWGLDDAGAAEQVVVQSLNTKSTRDAGIAFWAVNWKQPVAVTSYSPEAPLPITLYLQGPDGNQQFGGGP